MQAELLRKRILGGIMRRFKLNASVIVFAHSDMRATRDPVVPDSLPTTKRPLLRAAVEAELRRGLDELAGVAADPTGASVAEEARGAFTSLTPSLADAPPQRIKTAVLARILARAPTLPRPEALKLVWMALTRYQYLGLRSTMSAATPPDIYLKFERFDALEGFASLFNCALPRYYGLFPDLEAPFGCVGNFFGIEPTAAPRLLLCNPPYMAQVMNAFVNKALELLDGSQCTVVCVLPAFETADRAALNEGAKCKERYPVDYTTDVDTALLKASAHNRWCGLYCKERFRFVEPAREELAALTSVLVLVLSSMPKPSPSIQEIEASFPTRDLPCTPGTRAAAIYTSIGTKSYSVRSASSAELPHSSTNRSTAASTASATASASTAAASASNKSRRATGGRGRGG